MKNKVTTHQFLGVNGDDVITGTNSNDYLNGGAGNDTLTGNGGWDAFGMSSGGGHDLITDFTVDKTNSAYHDQVVFDGWGNFTDAIWSGHLPAITLATGMQFATDTGHVLTVTTAANGDLVLQWETGDSIEFAGVTPDHFRADFITSLDSYNLF